ncbi:MAG: hypothetical protein AB7P52_05140 [Alphaproteobacteria bacterium]
MSARTINIDPYVIDLAIAEVITALEESGALQDTEPDREYGYICETVYGVSNMDIAAIHNAGGAATDITFQLIDGRMFPAVPVTRIGIPRRGRVPH